MSEQQQWRDELARRYQEGDAKARELTIEMARALGDHEEADTFAAIQPLVSKLTTDYIRKGTFDVGVGGISDEAVLDRAAAFALGLGVGIKQAVNAGANIIAEIQERKTGASQN